MDSFDLHYKILSICEHLMQARRKIDSMTDEERKIAVSLLKRLLAESRDKKEEST